MKRIFFRSIFLIALITITHQSFSQDLNVAIRSYAIENYESAKSELTAITKNQSTDANAWYYLGMTYSKLDLNDSARWAFTHGVNADAKNYSNLIGLGLTYLNENNPDKAKESFDEAKGLTTQKDINYYLMVADAYATCNTPNTQGAITMVTRATELNNRSAEAWWEMGQAYESEMARSGGEATGQAVNAYENAVLYDPAMAKAYTRMGVIWRMAKNYDNSLENFNKAIAADAQFAPAYREFAELYAATGQYEKAKLTFQQYRELADKDCDVDYLYLKLLFLCKDYSGSIALAKELRQRCGVDKPMVWRLSGYSDYEMGNYQEGLQEMITFFQKTKPEKILSSDYEYYGKLFLKTGQDSLAALNIEKAIQTDSTKFTLYDTLAAYYFPKKNYAKAGFYYQKKCDAALKGPTLQDLFNAGKSFYFAADWIKADTAFARMSRVVATYPIPFLWRARVYENLEDTSNVQGLAAPYFQKMIQIAVIDTHKYRVELKEAYKYLGDINTYKENYGAAMYYYEKCLEIDPGNAEIAKTIVSIKAIYKNPPPPTSVTAQKDGDNFMAPLMMNDNSVNCTFNPMASGISINAATQSTIFGSSGGNVIPATIKWNDRSSKNFALTLVANQLAAAVIGADALNKMNVVFDYASASFIFR